ncbi:phage baseplate protein [Geomicrobium sp. JCM 19055]|uniref:phage baseplate protein n=1 Tax=Geomicrobium sp. JCM 19055 TaxID=1460649 RepID=UPI00045EDDFE|nr:hypothetical protein [Geomicrobium sp. JCM 19055]GAK01513.1 hypothetical protein JCM19055_4685 [Geomicrobium sp. JCM 19055]
MAYFRGSFGEVHFNILNEDRSRDNEVTEHPVEGNSIVDHVQQLPTVYSLQCVYYGDNPSQVHLDLLAARRSKEVIKYRGRANMKECVIMSMTTSVDQNDANGFRFNATIQSVRFARPSTSGLSGILRAEVDEIGSAGRVQTV